MNKVVAPYDEGNTIRTSVRETKEKMKQYKGENDEKLEKDEEIELPSQSKTEEIVMNETLEDIFCKKSCLVIDGLYDKVKV